MKTAAGLRSEPRGRYAVPLLVAALLLPILGGCKAGQDRHEVRGWLFADPSERHPIKVSEREIGMDLNVPRGARGLSRAQLRDAHEMVGLYRREGNGALLVRAPSGGANEGAALRALDDLRVVLKREGIPGSSVAFEPYFAGADPHAPVRVSFLRYVAQAPECGDWSENLARSPKNQNYKNFGCATQNNLAAVVANPRDLIEPRGLDPRSSERRDVVWDKWLKGETTGAEKSAEETATASDVAGGGN